VSRGVATSALPGKETNPAISRYMPDQSGGEMRMSECGKGPGSLTVAPEHSRR
jgi:hypothetical protein